MTNLGPLTTTFTATGADCQSTYLAANNDNQWLQYGQPDTTQCVPPSFTAFQQYYYSPGICPSGYYYACEAGVGTSSTQATCCPTTGINRETDPFACASTYSTDSYVSVMYYKFTSASGSPNVVNTSPRTTTFMVGETDGFNVEAYGPVVRRADGDPEWSTTTSSTTTNTANSDEQTGNPSSTSTSDLPGSTSSSEPASSGGGGLSVGASAGIGVGVGLGCIIFISCIVAAYVIGKRRRAATQELDGPETPPRRDGIPGQNQTVELGGSGHKPWELPGGYQHVPEMDGRVYRSEMDANDHPIELQASQGQHSRHGRDSPVGANGKITSRRGTFFK